MDPWGTVVGRRGGWQSEFFLENVGLSSPAREAPVRN